jgi:hypothetical protein
MRREHISGTLKAATTRNQSGDDAARQQPHDCVPSYGCRHDEAAVPLNRRRRDAFGDIRTGQRETGAW